MAEGRMLKKAISTSRRLGDLKTDSARMLYTWIIPHLDIEGRFYADPALIKGSIVPRVKSFTEAKISECLTDMASVELIRLYEIDGDKYLHLRKFEDHQSLRPDKEAQSSIPPPPETDYSRTTPGLLPEQDGITPAEVKRREDKISKEKLNARATPPPKMKFLDSVFLSATEHQKLQEVLGQKSLEIGIEKLDYSITVKGGKYKDHYKTILNWHKRGYLVDGSNGKKPPPLASGERDVREYQPEEMPVISEEERKRNLEKVGGFIKGLGRASP